jgi:hypothetical protein
MNRRLTIGGLLVAAALCAPVAQGGEVDCGSLQNAYGPYDYTNPEHRRDKIPLVDAGHFNMDVQTLKSGKSSVLPINDLDYTLRAVPNHHPALDAMMRYFLAGGPQLTFRTPECYFDRAMRFAPNDGQVYLLYGVYLHRRKKFEDAEQQYKVALQLLGDDSADAHYDMALLYTDEDRWGEAKQHALKAYQLGYPLPGLMNRLKRRGLWAQAEDQKVAAAQAAAAAGPPGTPAPPAGDAPAPAGNAPAPANVPAAAK